MLDSLKPYLQKIETEINSTLSIHDNWAETSFGSIFPGTDTQHFMGLLEPTASLVSLGGKRWRPLLLVLTAQALLENQTALSKEQKDKILELAYHLTPMVEGVHTASLIHDDIEDKSTERRGKPAAYITHGLDVALNAGSWLYFQAATCIDTASCSVETKNLLYKCLNQELRRLHLGQAMDIMWHSNPSILPTSEEYMAMVQYKTGTLSSLSCKIGAIASGVIEPEHLEETITSIGLAAARIGAGFQIIDDVINLTTGNPGKKRGDDVVEGKKSLPVLLYCQNVPPQDKIKLLSLYATAQKDGIQSPAVEEAIGMLEQQGSIKLAHQKGTALIKDSCQALENLIGAGSSMNLIKELFNSMIPSFSL